MSIRAKKETRNNMGDRVADRAKGREMCPENRYSLWNIGKSIAQGKRVVNKWVCGVCSHRKFTVDIGA